MCGGPVVGNFNSIDILAIGLDQKKLDVQTFWPLDWISCGYFIAINK